jgi:hypothetical protein
VNLANRGNSPFDIGCSNYREPGINGSPLVFKKAQTLAVYDEIIFKVVKEAEADLEERLCEHASITAATANLTAVLPLPNTLSVPFRASAGALRAPPPYRLT